MSVVLAGISGCSKAPEKPGPPDPSAESEEAGPRAKPPRPAPAIESDVAIVFAQAKYSFTLAQAAEGISIDYEIVVKRDFAGILPKPQGSAGEGLQLAEPKGEPERSGTLIPFAKLEGDGQRYGMFDIGLPPPRKVPALTIKQGRYKHSFEWDGRNWDGGSDTCRPKGDPFPPGIYTLEVSCVGLAASDSGPENFRIEKQVEITLTE